MDRSGEVISRARTQVSRSCYVWGAEGQDLCAQRDAESWVRSQETTGDASTRANNVRRVMLLPQLSISKARISSSKVKALLNSTSMICCPTSAC